MVTIVDKVSYNIEPVENGKGKITIRGLNLLHDNFDPLSKLWSCLRRRFREQYEIDIVASFFYSADSEDKPLIQCDFRVIGDQSARETFDINFLTIAEKFESVLNNFMAHIYGYREYALLLAVGGTHDDCRELLNQYLEMQGLRTQGDKKRAEKERNRAQAAKANREAAKSRNPDHIKHP